MQKENEATDKFESGTTTLGLTGDDVIVLAADKQATLGHLKASKEAKKIFSLDDRVAMTIAGSVGDAQKIVRIMRSQMKLYKLETKEMSPKASATFLSNLLHSSKMVPFMNQFILGGVDEDGPLLCTLDPVGGVTTHAKYTAIGSGSPTAYGVLEDSWQEEMGREETIKLAVRGVKAASERDINSGEGVAVGVVDKEGFELLSPEEVEDYL